MAYTLAYPALGGGDTLEHRTQLGEDFVRNENDIHSPTNSLYYNKDQDVNNRGNMDRTPIDRQSKKIIELRKYSSYRILELKELKLENSPDTPEIYKICQAE